MGAGKSTLGMVLAKRGYMVYELGDIVRQLMRESGTIITPDSDRKFSERLRKKYGSTVTPRLLLDKIKIGKNGKIAIVGVRSKKELDYIKKRLRGRGRIVTIAVVAPVRIRYERVRKRNRPDTPKSLAAFIKDKDAKEEKWGIKDAINSADYVVSGAGSVAELRKDANRLFSALESGK